LTINIVQNKKIALFIIKIEFIMACACKNSKKNVQPVKQVQKTVNKPISPRTSQKVTKTGKRVIIRRPI